MATFSTTIAADALGGYASRLAGGTLEFQDSGGSVLATLGLSNPAATVSGKTLTFATISDDTSIDSTATCTQARLKDSGGTVHISALTVGTTGTNIIVNTTDFVTGKNASMSSATITHP